MRKLQEAEVKNKRKLKLNDLITDILQSMRQDIEIFEAKKIRQLPQTMDDSDIMFVFISVCQINKSALKIKLLGTTIMGDWLLELTQRGLKL